MNDFKDCWLSLPNLGQAYLSSSEYLTLVNLLLLVEDEVPKLERASFVVEDAAFSSLQAKIQQHARICHKLIANDEVSTNLASFNPINHLTQSF